MQGESPKLEDLSRDECLRLLATARIGRVGLSVRALPVVLPVNFALLDDHIVVRTASGTHLDDALRDSVVAFQVDREGPGGLASWSVLVQGIASLITDPDVLARARALPLPRWAINGEDHFVQIGMDVVSGRRVEQPPAAP